MIVIIRDARASEHEALSRLAYDAKASWGYPVAWMHEWVDALTLTAAYIRANRVWVAEVDGEPIGLVSLEAGPPPEIGHLWVHPGYQGRGVGQRLMDHLVHAAEDMGLTEVQIVADPNAVPFYEKQGAVSEREIPSPVLGKERFLPLLRLRISAEAE